MTGPTDEEIARYSSQRDRLQSRLGQLQTEEGVLRDLLTNEEKWAEHPAARERLDLVSGQKGNVQIELDDTTQRLEVAKNLREQLPEVEQGQPGRGEVLTPADLERQRAGEEAAARDRETKELVEHAVHVAESDGPPTPAKDSPDHVATVGASSPDHAVVTGLEQSGEGAALGLIIVGAAGKMAYDNWRQGREFKAEEAKAIAEAMHEKQMGELDSLEADIAKHQKAANAELDKLGLSEAARSEAAAHEFEYASHQMNETFARHDQEWQDLRIHHEECAAGMQTRRDEMTHDLCQVEAERRVNASNEALVQGYAEARNPDQASLSRYEQSLQASAPQEVASTTQTLQQQTFPQVAQTGPAVPPPGQGISGP